MGRLKRQVCISFSRCLAALLGASQRVVHLSEEQHLDKGVLDADNSKPCSAFLKYKEERTMRILFPNTVEQNGQNRVPDAELFTLTVAHVVLFDYR